MESLDDNGTHKAQTPNPRRASNHLPQLTDLQGQYTLSSLAETLLNAHGFQYHNLLHIESAAGDDRNE